MIVEISQFPKIQGTESSKRVIQHNESLLYYTFTLPSGSVNAKGVTSRSPVTFTALKHSLCLCRESVVKQIKSATKVKK